MKNAIVSLLLALSSTAVLADDIFEKNLKSYQESLESNGIAVICGHNSDYLGDDMSLNNFLRKLKIPQNSELLLSPPALEQGQVCVSVTIKKSKSSSDEL